MFRKSFLLLIGLVLLFAVAAPAVHAERGIRVNWRVAGSFFNGFAQADSPNPLFLFQVMATGPPGSAIILGINQGPSTGTAPAADLEGCFEGANLKLVSVEGGQLNENSLAATFNDLSVLNMVLDETRPEEVLNCLRFSDGRFDYVVPIKFVGGFGRFEGATGEGIIRGQSIPIFPGSGFGSETGTITGTIWLP